MLKSKKFQISLGILLSVVFLWLAFRKVSITDMAAAFESADYWYFIPAAVFLFFSLWFRAYRWKFFFKSIKPIGMNNLFASMMVGYMANNIFPMRLGEFLRAYSIGRTAKVSKVSSFATIIVERIIDLLTLLVLLALTFLIQPFPSWIKDSGYVIFTIAVGAILFMGFLVFKTEPTLKLMEKMLSPFSEKIRSKILEYAENLISGFGVLRTPRLYLAVVVLSILIWACYVGIVQMIIMSFGLDVKYHLPLLASVVVQIMIGIGVTIPSSPGYIGTFHYLAMQGMALFGVPGSEALSVAIVLHLFNFIPLTLIGFYYFARENLKFSDVLQEKKLAETAK
ncbi:hypothetical protein BMS3Abin05_01620 [bacterium BMS3Abin05]|nr:hypothetical protein BMS3Abin05_01620 [bacterium BMS3Abin05]GBE27076.1 hypothetical protein BMS3Bbin03_00996 [bacterium BMS3Bbin03]HDZ11432.1 flippase-like domain-containing protein [Bacteroidota bacterium]